MESKTDATFIVETLSELVPFIEPQRVTLSIGKRSLWAARVSPVSSTVTYIYFCSKGWWYQMREDGAEKIDAMEWRDSQIWELMMSIIFLSGMATGGAESGMLSKNTKPDLGLSKYIEALDESSGDLGLSRKVRKLARDYSALLGDRIP